MTSIWRQLKNDNILVFTDLFLYHCYNLGVPYLLIPEVSVNVSQIVEAGLARATAVVPGETVQARQICLRFCSSFNLGEKG